MSTSLYNRKQRRLVVAGVAGVAAAGLALLTAGDARAAVTAELGAPLRWPAAPVCGHFTRAYVPASVGKQVTEWVDGRGQVRLRVRETGVQNLELDEAELRSATTYLRSSAGLRGTSLVLSCASAEISWTCRQARTDCEPTIKRQVKNPWSPETAAAETAALQIFRHPEQWQDGDPRLVTAVLVLARQAADALEVGCAGGLCAGAGVQIAALRALQPDNVQVANLDREALGRVDFKHKGRLVQASCNHGEFLPRECRLQLDSPFLRFEDTAQADAHRHVVRDPAERWSVRVEAYQITAPEVRVQTGGTILR